MRFVGNRQEPEEDPQRSLEFKPVMPELPFEHIDWGPPPDLTPLQRYIAESFKVPKEFVGSRYHAGE
jgi:hypothetical protein